MNPAEYARMRALEDWYWWFVARREAALRFLADHAPRERGLRILDAGCGTGAVLAKLEQLPESMAVGLDFATKALCFCRERGHTSLVQGDLMRLPIRDGEFDAVVALDVIEHLPDDHAAVAEVARVLRPGGVRVASVPAYRLLWGPHDVALHHHRRYRRREMEALATGAGLQVARSSYILTALFPVAAAQRLAARLWPPRPGQEVAAGLPPVPGWLNRALISLQRLELAVARRVPLPWGLSILLVARKPG